MPDRAEVQRSLYGVYRLALLDPQGFGYLNLSVEGFWNSFFAAILAAPAYAILIADTVLSTEESVDLGWFVIVETIAYIIGWAAFPVAALIATRFLGLGRNYAILVIAANWAVVLQVTMFLMVVLLTPMLPESAGSLAMLVATVAILAYQWFITRTALQTTGGIAAALVILDLTLNILISLSAERLA